MSSWKRAFLMSLLVFTSLVAVSKDFTPTGGGTQFWEYCNSRTVSNTSACPSNCTTATACTQSTWNHESCDIAYLPRSCVLDPPAPVLVTVLHSQCTQSGSGCQCPNDGLDGTTSYWSTPVFRCH